MHWTQDDERIQAAFRAMQPKYTDELVMITGYVDPATGLVATDPLTGLSPGQIWLHDEALRTSVPALIGEGMRAYTRASGVRCETGINSSGLRVAIQPVADAVNAPVVAQYHAAGQSAQYIQGNQFTPGLLVPWTSEVGGSEGLNVYVVPITHGTTTITGHIALTLPGSASESRQAVVYWDVSDGALGVVYGTTSTQPASLFTLETAAAIALGDTDRIRLGAVLLTNGMTNLNYNTTTFYDCRDFLTLESGGAVDATDVTYTPSTPSDWGVVPTTTQEGLDTLASGGAGGTSGAKTRVVGTLLYDLTLASADRFDTSNTPDFGTTGLASGYDWIEIVIERAASTVSAATDFAYILFNNDSTLTNYRRQAEEASSGAGSFGAADDAIIANVTGATALANNLSTVRILLPNYTTADHKQAYGTQIARSAASGQEIAQWGVWWESTSAITRVQVQPDGYSTDKFATGSRMRIYGWKQEAVGGGAIYSSANVSNPPTDAELDSAFGTPATVGAGFLGVVNDNGAGTNEYLCWSDGTNWFYATGTLAT